MRGVIIKDNWNRGSRISIPLFWRLPVPAFVMRYSTKQWIVDIFYSEWWGKLGCWGAGYWEDGGGLRGWGWIAGGDLRFVVMQGSEYIYTE